PPRSCATHDPRCARAALLRRIRVPGHGRLQGGRRLGGVPRDRQGRGGDGRAAQRVPDGGGMTEPERPAPRPADELGLESILYEKAPPRATITLNRPDVLNAF